MSKIYSIEILDKNYKPELKYSDSGNFILLRHYLTNDVLVYPDEELTFYLQDLTAGFKYRSNDWRSILISEVRELNGIKVSVVEKKQCLSLSGFIRALTFLKSENKILFETWNDLTALLDSWQ